MCVCVCGESMEHDMPYALLFAVARNYDSNKKLNHFNFFGNFWRGRNAERQNNDINTGFTDFYGTKFTLELIVNETTVRLRRRHKSKHRHHHHLCECSNVSFFFYVSLNDFSVPCAYSCSKIENVQNICSSIAETNQLLSAQLITNTDVVLVAGTERMFRMNW